MHPTNRIEVTDDLPVWRRQVSIAHMAVGIECEESGCMQGIADLTVLFPASHQSVPDMLFSIKPSAGILQLTLDDELLWQGKDAGEVVAAFEYEFYNRVIGALYPPLISLHASTVSVNGTCITCAGISGAGKSSLCTVALLAGATYFSDEFTLLDTAGHIVPFPRPLQWGSEEHPAFSHEIMLKSGRFNKTSYHFPDRSGNTVTSLLWHPEHLAKVPEPMCIVLLPQYDPTSSTATLTELRRSQGIMELAAHVHHNLPPTKRILHLHERISDQATFYRLSFSDVHAAWKQVETFTAST